MVIVKTALTISPHFTRLTIRCPYCDKESPIKSWNFDIEQNNQIRIDDKRRIDCVLLSIKCPFCDESIDIYCTKQRLSVDYMIKLYAELKQIEGSRICFAVNGLLVCGEMVWK